MLPDIGHVPGDTETFSVEVSSHQSKLDIQIDCLLQQWFPSLEPMRLQGLVTSGAARVPQLSQYFPPQNHRMSPQTVLAPSVPYPQ